MKKLLFILLTGVLLSLVPSSEAAAQRIEYDSLGIPHACTNYDLHLKQNRQIRVGRLAAYAVGIAGVIIIANAANDNDDGWSKNMENLGKQSAYALGAAVGAVLVVQIYKWDVKLKTKAGL